MSDLFSPSISSESGKIHITRELRSLELVQNLRNDHYEILEIDESQLPLLENSIVLSYPGKGKVYDEKLPNSSFVIILDADDALERLMSQRCFFIDSSLNPSMQQGLVESLLEIVRLRHVENVSLARDLNWEERVQEALSGFDYLVKSLSRHLPGDVHQDEGVADILDFFLRVLAFKERAVSITSWKSFWESLTSTFPDFSIEISDQGEIPVGKKPWNAREKQKSKYGLLKIMGLAFLVSEFVSQSEVIERQKEEALLWEEALAHFPYPVALISSGGDLVANNANFTQLSIFPADCLRLKTQEKIELANGVFRVEKMRLDGTEGDDSLFVFLFRNDRGASTRSGSNEELGIISSSIAHELNNPLAGILASLALVELEDELGDDLLQAVRDMKTGARRCKELVEIFLGFSRATPRNLTGAPPSLEAFEKALSLSRFRMIESNLRLDFSTSKQTAFHRETNTSILAMVWYLILGEVMTASSHHQLVTEKSGAIIRGRFVEKEHSLELSVDGDFPWSDGVLASKLLQHLVELAGLTMICEDGKLLLKDWTLT